MAVEGRRKWWALAALALSVLVVGLDLTVLNVALPTLATDLHASTGDLQWFANAYNLALAAALLPAGLLGDRFGRKRLLLGALVLFGVASAACAYASSVGLLIGARAVLGLAAAFLIPLCMAQLPVLFTDEERPRALAIWVTANFVGMPLGPIVGGWLLGHVWWGAVFLLNVPVVVVAVVVVALLLPESRAERRPGLDPLGVVLGGAGLAALSYGVIRAGETGWTRPAALATMLAGALLLVVFVGWQRYLTRRPGGQPLIDLSLFRSRGFTGGTVLATLVSFAMFGLMFVMPQYFQAVEGAGALGTGTRLLPIVGGMLVGARLGGVVTKGLPMRVSVALGFVLLAGGLFVGASTGTHTSYWLVATWMAVMGAGLGLGMPAAMNVALGALSAERSGSGSALIQAVRQIGGTIGVAILGSVLNAGYRGRVDTGGLPAQAAGAVRASVAAGAKVAGELRSAPLLESVRSAFTHATDVMLWVCGGIAAAGVVLALVILPRRPGAPRPAAGTAGTEQADQGREVVVSG
jgi:DHA2 family multidrug resistance protein-like MFS transporter